MPPKKGQLQKRGRVRREQIFSAAVELFSVNGYYGTPLAAVAERVGITTPGILHHFETKEALLVAVVEEYDEQHHERWDSVAAARGLDALRQFPDMVEGLLEEPDLLRFFSVISSENLHSDGPIHGFFVKRSRRSVRWVAGILRSGQADGEIREDLDVLAKAREILAFQDGVLDNWLLDPDRYEPVVLYRQYIEMVIRDLRVPVRGRRRPASNAAGASPRQPARTSRRTQAAL